MTPEHKAAITELHDILTRDVYWHDDARAMRCVNALDALLADLERAQGLIESMMRYTALMHDHLRDCREVYQQLGWSYDRGLAATAVTLAHCKLAQAAHADISLAVRRALGIEGDDQ